MSKKPFIKDDTNKLVISGYLEEKYAGDEKKRNAVIEETIAKGKAFLKAWQIPDEAVAEFKIWKEIDGSEFYRCPNDPLVECRLLMYPKKYIG